MWSLGLIPGLGRSPGEGNGNPLQCACLRNPWTEESGRLQFTGVTWVGYDLVNKQEQYTVIYVCVCLCVCMHTCMLSRFSCVLLFAILWTVAYQAPLPWDFPGKNTGVGCCAHLQKIFPIQGLNPHLLHCRQILHCWGTGEALCICIYVYNWNIVV